jgi:hypothetical protein
MRGTRSSFHETSFELRFAEERGTNVERDTGPASMADSVRSGLPESKEEVTRGGTLSLLLRVSGHPPVRRRSDDASEGVGR